MEMTMPQWALQQRVAIFRHLFQMLQGLSPAALVLSNVVVRKNGHAKR
jgi:hypothetical protein